MSEFFEKKWVHITLVLLVFTCTGLSVAQIGRMLTGWLEVERFSLNYWLIWIFALLPIYQVILLIYAFIFGKFTYFKQKQLRLWRKITGRSGKSTQGDKKEK